MKVASRSWDILNPEKLYKQTELNVGGEKHLPQQPSKSRVNPSHEKSVNGIMPAAELLSENEIKTLQALFGYEQNNFSFYGKNQLKNVQSGFLLDIKG